MWREPVLVLGSALVSVSLGELLSWLLIYRTESYKTLKNQIEFSQQKLEKQKEAADSSLGGDFKQRSRKQKKIAKAEERLTEENGRMMLVKMKSMVVVGVVMFLFVWQMKKFLGLNNQVVAILPFVPLKIFQRFSLRGLSGKDPTECAFHALYILCTMALRPMVQKLTGNAPPPGMSSQSLFAPRKLNACPYTSTLCMVMTFICAASRLWAIATPSRTQNPIPNQSDPGMGQRVRAHPDLNSVVKKAAEFRPRLVPSVGSRRASVAIILRVRPDSISHENDVLSDDLCDYSVNDVDILFLKRAANPRDPWSGHVCFPGGRREDSDDGDFSCVVRETLEETGLDLREFRYIGRLNDRRLARRWIDVVCVFVFLQSEVETPRIVLQESELVAWRWAPLSLLVECTPKMFSPRVSRLGAPFRFPFGWASDIIRILHRTFVRYPCVLLPENNSSSSQNVSYSFRLWGLTYGFVSELLLVMELRTVERSVMFTLGGLLFVVMSICRSIFRVLLLAADNSRFSE